MARHVDPDELFLPGLGLNFLTLALLIYWNLCASDLKVLINSECLNVYILDLLDICLFVAYRLWG